MVLQVAGQAMSVMAMANARGHIEEILATPAGNAGVRLADAEACHAHGADFAAGLAATLGPMEAWSVQHKPVSTEFIFVAAGDTPGAAARAWFRAGLRAGAPAICCFSSVAANPSPEHWRANLRGNGIAPPAPPTGTAAPYAATACCVWLILLLSRLSSMTTYGS